MPLPTDLARPLAAVVAAGAVVAILAATLAPRPDPASATTAAEAGAAAETPARLVTVLAAPDPETQLMAMVLTTQAVARGTEARVLLCGPGARIAWAEPPETATAPQAPKGASPQGLLAALVAQGVRAEVCAIHLPNAGLTEDALIEGVGVAQPPAMGAALLAPGARLLTF